MLFANGEVVVFTSTGYNDICVSPSKDYSRIGGTDSITRLARNWKKEPMKEFVIRESKVGSHGIHIVKIQGDTSWYCGDWFAKKVIPLFDDNDFYLE